MPCHTHQVDETYCKRGRHSHTQTQRGTLIKRRGEVAGNSFANTIPFEVLSYGGLAENIPQQSLLQLGMAGYLLYSISFCFLVLATGIYHNFILAHCADLEGFYVTRDRWIHRLPLPTYIYHRLPPTFSNDIEDGLTSSDFDLSGNIGSGDLRAGLDDHGKQEVKRIMRSNRVGFDEARRIYTERRFAKNNIDPDGLPRDPKFVSFS